MILHAIDMICSTLKLQNIKKKYSWCLLCGLVGLDERLMFVPGFTLA